MYCFAPPPARASRVQEKASLAQPSNITPFTSLLDQFRSGQIDRRRFITGASLLGISASAAGVLTNGTNAFAQGTPAGTPATAVERPAVGT